jgi:aspartyl-tRNA(Asn)/glutamyl-tRNA(Gln) amidotransferase subunit B
MLPDDIANMLVRSSEYGLTIKDAKSLVALNDGDRLEYYLDIVEILGKEFSENSQSLEKVGKIVNNW